MASMSITSWTREYIGTINGTSNFLRLATLPMEIGSKIFQFKLNAEWKSPLESLESFMAIPASVCSVFDLTFQDGAAACYETIADAMASISEAALHFKEAAQFDSATESQLRAWRGRFRLISDFSGAISDCNKEKWKSYDLIRMVVKVVGVITFFVPILETALKATDQVKAIIPKALLCVSLAKTVANIAADYLEAEGKGQNKTQFAAFKPLK